MPVLLFFLLSWSRKTHSLFSSIKYKSKINKAMCMHILIMTLNKNKLNNAHLSVFCKLSSTIKGWDKAF